MEHPFNRNFLTFEDEARLEIMNKPEQQDMEKPLARTGYVHIAFSVGKRLQYSIFIVCSPLLHCVQNWTHGFS